MKYQSSWRLRNQIQLTSHIPTRSKSVPGVVCVLLEMVKGGWSMSGTTSIKGRNGIDPASASLSCIPPHFNTRSPHSNPSQACPNHALLISAASAVLGDFPIDASCIPQPPKIRILNGPEPCLLDFDGSPRAIAPSKAYLNQVEREPRRSFLTDFFRRPSTNNDINLHVASAGNRPPSIMHFSKVSHTNETTASQS